MLLHVRLRWQASMLQRIVFDTLALCGLSSSHL